MNHFEPIFRNLVGKWLLLPAGMLALSLLMATPRVHADTIDECQHRIAHADHELHEAIERYGHHSREAEHERRELHRARERCWREHHRWWSEDEHRWHEEHDWDDRDHDRD